MKRRLLTFAFLISFIFSFGQNRGTIFTSDIENFWAAYDSVKSTSDSIKQIKFIQTLYLDKATEGLKDFIKLREHSAKRHLLNIFRYPKFWVSLRPKTLEIQNHISDIEKVISNFKNQYPDFKEPEIYFTIGILNSGGTTSTDKVLIGSEIACSDKTVDATELKQWLQDVFELNAPVVSLVAHELGHTQQKDLDRNVKSNLLGYSIREGACDFLAELIYQPVLSPYMTYGNANEKELWTAFQQEMYGQEVKNWLYNGSQAPNGNADLGYFIGYKICKSYYDNSKNKKKALEEIITLKYDKESVEEFLKNSKYKGGR